MITKTFNSVISFLCAILITFLPFNFIIGSKFSWFSGAIIAIPALASQQSLLYVIFYFFSKSMLTASFAPIFILQGVPTIFASLALRYWDYKIAVIIPVCAMFLFWMHPTGAEVFYYAWYWFIPGIIYFVEKDTMITRAFIASFVSHAVGSVIWLYTREIPAFLWDALVPIVIFERIMIAGGMIGCILLFRYIHEFVGECKSKVMT